MILNDSFRDIDNLVFQKSRTKSVLEVRDVEYFPISSGFVLKISFSEGVLGVLGVPLILDLIKCK